MSVLETICVECGASEASGIAPDLAALPNPPKRELRARVEAAVELEPSANLVFVHRDADGGPLEHREQEIAKAVAELEIACIPVVPTRATEAWLLLDEGAIRSVADNPRGRMKLELPTPKLVEQEADPKSKLRRALLAASGLTGRKLKKFRKAFPRRRALLLERLNAEVLKDVRACQRVREAIRAFVGSNT